MVDWALKTKNQSIVMFVVIIWFRTLLTYRISTCIVSFRRFLSDMYGKRSFLDTVSVVLYSLKGKTTCSLLIGCDIYWSYLNTWYKLRFSSVMLWDNKKKNPTEGGTRRSALPTGYFDSCFLLQLETCQNIVVNRVKHCILKKKVPLCVAVYRFIVERAACLADTTV